MDVTAFSKITRHGECSEKYPERPGIAKSKAAIRMRAVQEDFAWPSNLEGLVALEDAGLSDDGRAVA